MVPGAAVVRNFRLVAVVVLMLVEAAGRLVTVAVSAGWEAVASTAAAAESSFVLAEEERKPEARVMLE